MENLDERVNELFLSAMDLAPTERDAYLAKMCRDSLELRARVDSMLEQNERAGSFLIHPILGAANQAYRQDERVTARASTCLNAVAHIPPQYAPQFKAGDLLFERFLVIKFIARGGMGEVYEVEDRQLRGVHVALKTILSQYATDPIMQGRFEREVLHAREVVHPNVCPIYDIFHWKRTDGNLIFLTMKLLPGETLASRLERTGFLSELEAKRIIEQVGGGLGAAHAVGILHRDIKAANIMLNGSAADVSACITDFGLARPAQNEITVLTVDGLVGTPIYMAPELLYGAPPSKASDIYSLGIVTFQIITGRFPYSLAGKDRFDLEKAVAGASARWRPFLIGCLQSEPEKRFSDVVEAVRNLPGIVSDSPSMDRGFRLLSRRRAIMVGGAATACAVGGVFLEWDSLQSVVSPLPKPRSVALIEWPRGDSPAIVATVLASIGQRLARAEEYVKDLLIIMPKDVPPSDSSIDTPAKCEAALGANLVLSASLKQERSKARLRLAVLESHSGRVLRRGETSCQNQEISTLAEKASKEAAALLHLPFKDVQLSDPEELSTVSPEVFQLFSEAEEKMGRPNHAGLQEAILTYQRGLDLNEHFALGYAKLAIAYVHSFFITHEAANIDLASRNAEKSLHCNPRSAMGLLSHALVLICLGDSTGASTFFSKALQADPGNPDVLFQKAWALQRQGQLDHAAQAYRDILDRRPNYWPAYNNIGVIYARNASYKEAAKSFAAAGAAAPQASLPMANLGATYIQLGMRNEARTALTESVKRGAGKDTYLALGDLDFEDSRYGDALKAYKEAAKLDPNYHLIQRNMGDCYVMLGDSTKVKECYQEAARLLSGSLSIDSKDGFGWANLAFYHAKIGQAPSAEADIKNADLHGATDVASRFMITQALVLLGRKKEALTLLIWCIDHHLSEEEVNLAIDLRDLRKDRDYLSHLKRRKLDKGATNT